MFFDNRGGSGHVPVVGPLDDAALVPALRVSGKRTATELNAFDPVVTVAPGSTPATVLLSKDVALALSAGSQFATTWPSVRSGRFRGFVEAEPALLLHRGRFLDAAPRARARPAAAGGAPARRLRAPGRDDELRAAEVAEIP